MSRAALSVVIVALFISYLRLFFGMNDSDECQYLAHILVPFIGGSVFVTDLILHQTAQWLAMPAMAVYLAIFDFEGIVLFVRHLFWLMAVAGFFIWLQFLREYRGHFTTVIAASVFLLFVPYSLPSWSYNTVAYHCFSLSMLLISAPSIFRGQAAIGGALSVLSCFAYPSLIFAAIPLLGYAYISDIEVRRRATAIFTAAGFTALILLALIWRAGIENLLDTVAFSKQFYVGGGLSKFSRMVGQIQSGISVPSKFFFAALIAFFAVGKDEICLKCALICVAILMLSFVDNRLTEFPAQGWMLYAMLTVILFRFYLRHNKHLVPLPWHLQFAAQSALVAGMVFSYTSSNGAICLPNGFAAAFVIYFVQILSSLDAHMRTAEFNRAWALAVSLFFFLFLPISSFAYRYRDHEPLSQSVRVAVGPFRGIYTSRIRAHMLEQLDADLKAVSRGRRTIFSAYVVPAYLSVRLRPETILFNTPILRNNRRAEQRVLARIKVPGGEPEIAVVARVPQAKRFRDFFSQESKYKLYRSRPEYEIYTRENDNPLLLRR